MRGRETTARQMHELVAILCDRHCKNFIFACCHRCKVRRDCEAVHLQIYGKDNVATCTEAEETCNQRVISLADVDWVKARKHIEERRVHHAGGGKDK